MNTRFIRSFIFLPIFLLFIVLLNEHSVQAQQEAEQIYRTHCMSCHGTNLQGGFGPNLQNVGSRLTKQAIVGKIVFGSGQMPSFGNRLSPAAIQLLGDWLSRKQ